MPRKLPILVALLLALAAGAVLFVRLRSEPALEKVAAAPASPASPATIAASGEILGVAIGMPMNDVRAKLDPLRAPDPAYRPDQKELQGRRVYWKLSGTDYDWIMVWGGKDGKATRVRAVYRAEHRKPYAEIGDVAQAVTADPTMVRWNLQTATGSRYRLAVQGAENRAVSVYMFSQDIPETDQQQESPAHLEEK
jgi:hypothetical protein